MKSGFITIIGKTNAGKSTLVNQILKKKVSIVTYKAQTTRNAIQGIYNDEDSQIIFIDTPGILKPRCELDTFMSKEAFTSLSDVEGVIYLIDASKEFDEKTNLEMKSRLATLKVPLFIVLNKIDLSNILLMNELKKQYSEYFKDAKIIEISALDGFNVDYLIQEVKNILHEGYLYYSKNSLSNFPLKFLFGELIREQLFLLLKEEIPYSCAVKVENFEKKNNTIHVRAKIIVEKESQKGIVIGKKGLMLKQIAKNSRLEMEKITNTKINLTIFVGVENDWRNSSRILKEYGYEK